MRQSKDSGLIKLKASNYNPVVQIAALRNTVLASPRNLIVFIENNYQEDGSIKIPKALQPYMGGKTKIELK